MGGEKEMNMIYRFLAENNNGLQLVVDYYEKQDAINKKNQFEKWDELKPEEPKHIVTIYEIPENLYQVIHEKELNNNLDYQELEKCKL